MIPLFERRLVAVAGKGGVGRTTVSAALALAASRAGKRVLLCQVNARERLSRLLGGPAVGEDVVKVRDRLFAVNMNPRAALHEYGLMVLRYERVYKAVLENRMAKAFLRAIPGLDDYSMLGKVWYHTTEVENGRPKWDLVVMDLQATGHSMTMLRLPRAILEAVPEGPLVRDARSAAELLADPARTGMVIVTLAEEMPVTESAELYAAARQRVGIDIPRVVVNQLWPARFEAGPPAEVLRTLEATRDIAADPVLGPIVERARTARQRRELNMFYVERLKAEVPVAQAHLPLVFARSFGVEQVELLASELGRQVGG